MSEEKKETPMEGVEKATAENLLLVRLREKHAELFRQRTSELQKALEVEHSFASRKMHNLPPSLDLISDEIVIKLNEIGTRCEEYAVPQVGQLLKDVRMMMNRQLREAYASLEAGYKSAFHKLEEEAEGSRRWPEASNTTRQSEGKSKWKLQAESSSPTEDSNQSKYFCKERLKRQDTVPKTLRVRDTFLTMLGFFAETTAVLLRCEVVRIFLYDEYENLRCCARFPFNSTLGDPTSGNDMELMLAKELHSTVCQKCIAVNGREARLVAMRERDRGALEEELQQIGWHSMTSCLIFPVFSSDGCGRAFGMIHAVNKQGVSVGKTGTFDDNDEVFMSVTARLLGCLLTRYPTKLFVLSVGEKLRNFIPSSLKKNEESHLPPIFQDEVEGAAEVGNKANQMFTRVLLYRAPINVIYQTRSLRKEVRKLESLNVIDRALSTVEFDIAALEELWRVGREENIIMYQQCQRLNEQLNALQILLRNVLDAIGASRVLCSMSDLVRYIQALEVYARQENISMITELISGVLTNPRAGVPALPGLGEDSPERLSPTEMIRIERRVAQTPLKLKFGAETPSNVRTYSYDPERKREKVRFLNQLAEEREMNFVAKFAMKPVARHEAETKTTMAKRANQPAPFFVQFGPTDYASKRPFQIGNS
ncbi:hypothetical protein MOQ_002472 [Trypanosoma cruzi marinkellei]|uniref:GAF domain-containing protein n=1 Tax=Trypanosoma cruzi marinkellei TaxID=85056 RepID=K2MEH5_TRYCR|nr:hypothetical protein MOQ_002472 [Trypanosoma cruzi marinkellei]